MGVILPATKYFWLDNFQRGSHSIIFYSEPYRMEWP